MRWWSERRARAPRAAATALTALGGAWGSAVYAAEPVPTYRADYEVSYRGRHVGSSEFSVTREGPGAYRFESVSRFRGWLRLLSPNPLVEVSEFTMEEGRIHPLTFSFQDGSRRGTENYSVRFDWDAGAATITTPDRTVQSALAPGTLDRGSTQVALMLDLRDAAPGAYTLVDEEGSSVYEFSVEGEETLETPVGTVRARKLLRQRAGSSRRTLIWAAPALRFLPVRMEQQRDGVTRIAFTLQSVQWLDGGTAR